MDSQLINAHDIWLNKLFIELQNCDKEKIVNNFLSSFSTNRLVLRSALPVFAIMQSFPKHNFILRENQDLKRESPCQICSSAYGYPLELDLKSIEILETSIRTGGLIGHRLVSYYYYLAQKTINTVSQVNNEDIRIFKEILNIILRANEKDTLKQEVQKKIGQIKGFKSNVEQRRILLETLGYCGILETSEHKGLLHYYINLSTAPLKTISSDWNYPADWWTGKDSINPSALKYWFGSFNELEEFWK
jgi:hypothetical protein